MSGKVTAWSIRRKDGRTGRWRISSVEEILYLTYTGLKTRSMLAEMLMSIVARPAYSLLQKRKLSIQKLAMSTC